MMTPAQRLESVSTRRFARAHELRLIAPDGGVLFSWDVALGSEPQARRVPRCVLVGYALGACIEVLTTRGWQPRRVIEARDGACYLRTL